MMFLKNDETLKHSAHSPGGFWKTLQSNTPSQCLISIYNVTHLIILALLLWLQGRHTKTGQLAAIKVMNVTEVMYHLCVNSEML